MTDWPLFEPMPWSMRRNLAWRILCGDFNQVRQIVTERGLREEITLRTRPPKGWVRT